MPYFHPESTWNVPLPAAPRRLYPKSAACAAKLAASVHTGTTPWLSEIPIWAVLDTTPGGTIQVPGDIGSAFMSMPIPVGAKGDPTSDRKCVIADWPTQRMWELFQFDPAARTASTGGVWTEFQSKSGWFDEMSCGGLSAVAQGSRRGVRASGASMAAGIITVWEVTSGVIPHALALEIPRAAAYKFASPAQRTDNPSGDAAADAIPYGARFWLPPMDYPAYCQAHGWTPTRFGKAVTTAMMKYGVIPVDQTGMGAALVLESGESWCVRNPGQPHPWYGPSGMIQLSPSEEMRRLPWDKLVMLDPVLRTNV